MKPCALFVDENGIISVNWLPEPRSFISDLRAISTAIRCKDQEQAAGIIVLNHENCTKYRGSYAIGVKPGVYPIPGLTFKTFDIAPMGQVELVAILSVTKQKAEQREKLIELMKADEESGMYEQNYVQVVQLPKDEQIALYMKHTKLEIAEMLYNCNVVLNGLIKQIKELETRNPL